MADADGKASNIDLESISVLIPQSREGDVEARNQLLAQIQDYLDLMAQRHMDKSLQQKVGPSDIVQQTLTQVIENFDDFRGTTAAEFRGWLKVIVVNEMAKMRRTYRAGKRDIGREQHLDGQRSAVKRAITPADNHLTPSSEAIAAEQIENFHDILEQLPHDYAQVIRLRSIQRLPFRDIAEQMDRSHDSVTKLWYRAVLKFEEKLRQLGDFTSEG
ncbi:MAG: sigma-70 family RNA polymerase sigma factor [Pirellulaceae bacterium]